MQKRIRVITAIALVFTLMFSSGAVYGASLSEIREDIKAKQKTLQEGKNKEAELNKQIQGLETEINTAENQLETLRGKIETTEGKVATAAKDLKQAEQDVKVQNQNLNVRLRTMYKNGSIGFMDVLLGSGSISEFISNIDMVKKVYSSDKDVLADLEKDYATIEKKKKELETLEGQLEDQKQEQISKQTELTANRNEVSKKKANVVASNEALEDNISDLNTEADRVAAIIENDSKKNNSSSGGGGNSGGGSGGSSYGDGQFAWPVPGWSRISSGYGWRNCPFHGREKHTGIDIPASYGSAVVAAAKGKVIFSGYLGSYGNAIIISHGGGLYTLYAHNSSLVVSSGTRVSKGKKVARIGSTGSSTGNHSHFEVRKGGSGYGNDVNPWNYL